MQPNSPSVDAEVRSEAAPPLRILLVDDSAPFRRIVERILKPFSSLSLIGEAADGNSGIEMALALRPDIIVMDVQMPGLNGIEATRRIKTSLPEVAVIGVSALEHPMIHEAMRAAGASVFIPKQSVIALPEVIEQITGRCLANNDAL
jgi:DNA-binding NarL/FixJ family response regulator